jgi:hypothetical protein
MPEAKERMDKWRCFLDWRAKGRPEQKAIASQGSAEPADIRASVRARNVRRQPEWLIQIICNLRVPAHQVAALNVEGVETCVLETSESFRLVVILCGGRQAERNKHDNNSNSLSQDILSLDVVFRLYYGYDLRSIVQRDTRAVYVRGMQPMTKVSGKEGVLGPGVDGLPECSDGLNQLWQVGL